MKKQKTKKLMRMQKMMKINLFFMLKKKIKLAQNSLLVIQQNQLHMIVKILLKEMLMQFQDL